MKGQGCNRELSGSAGRMTACAAVARHLVWSLVTLVVMLLVSTQAKLFAQATITTVASGGATTKFDGIGVAVNAIGEVYTTGSTLVSNGATTKWIPAVLKLNASGNALLVEGSQSDPYPQYGIGVCGRSAVDIDPTDMGGVAVDDSGVLYSAMAGGYPPVLRISGGNVSCLEWGPSGPQAAQDVVLDNSGNVYFLSQDLTVGHYWVYKVASSGAGTPTVIAGTANLGCNSHPWGLALDNQTGNLYIADASCNVVWKVTQAGIITRYAGNLVANPDPTHPVGDGGVATNAELNQPRGVAVDAYGNLYIADWADNRIRKVDSAGIITTIAGTGVAGYAGDNGDPTTAELQGPWGIAVGPGGKIYVGDSANAAVRLMTPGAQIMSPPPGSVLPGTSVNFTWSGAPAGSTYNFKVSDQISGGTTFFSNTTPLSGQSQTVANLPCDGRTIYVQLETNGSNPGLYTYKACNMLSISLSPTSLSQQGGTVTISVTVTNFSPMPETLTVTVTDSLYPPPPCVYNWWTNTWTCPIPAVIGQQSTILLQPNDHQTLLFTAKVGMLPPAYQYAREILFRATVTLSGATAVQDSAGSLLIQY